MTVVSGNSNYVTVGLLWHSLSSGNLGVGALTESNIAIIRGVADRAGIKVRFLVLGSNEGNVQSLAEELRAGGHDIESHRVRMFRSSYRELVKRCDLVVDIGEGDSFADIYGLKRFLFYWLSKNIVCSLGKPLILAPQTIGPFDGTLAKILAKQVMRRCTKVFARDNLSTEYLRKLGVTSNAEEAIDVAFRLPYERSKSPDDGKVRVGINVSGLLFNGGYTGNNQFGLSIDYARTIREILTFFCGRPEVEVHLVSHVIEPEMPVEDDVRAAELLAKEFPGVKVAPAFSRPSEAKSYISGLDFFIGARMHACIAAFSSGVPVVPMAYSRKFNGLFGSLGYQMLADCKRGTDKGILERMFDGYETRFELAEKISSMASDIEARIAVYESVIHSSLIKIGA